MWIDETPCLAVELVPTPEFPVPAEGTAWAHYLDPRGVRVSEAVPVRGEPRLAFHQACAGSVSLEVLDGADELVGVALAELGPDARERELRVPLGGERRRVRVVDAAGEPVVGASFGCMCRHAPGAWSFGRVTDARGEAEWGPAPCDDLVAFVRHGEGVHSPIDLRSSGPPEEVQVIELDLSHAVRARLVDRDGPAAGITADVYEPETGAIVLYQATDAGGEVVWPSVSPGRYRIRAQPAGYWPLDEEIDSTGGEDFTPVPVRRLGGLRLELSGLDPGAVEGVGVALRSLELDVEVGEWLAAGRVTSSTGGLWTDAAGALELAELPNGEYAWEVPLPDGTVRSGTAEVPPGGVGDTILVFP